MHEGLGRFQIDPAKVGTVHKLDGSSHARATEAVRSARRHGGTVASILQARAAGVSKALSGAGRRPGGRFPRD
jgi:hypothetical protein